MAAQGGGEQAQAQASLGGAAGGKPFIEAQQLAQLQQMMAQMPPKQAEAMAAKLSEQLDMPIPSIEEMT